MSEIPDTVLRSLRYIRNNFQNAQKLSERPDSYSRATSIHKLDNCCEWVLNLALSEYDVDDRRMNIYDLHEELSSKVEVEQFHHWNRIKQLRTKRNSIQHDMDIPDNHLCIRNTKYVHGFIKDIVSRVWDLDFDELYMSQLINNDTLKRQVSEAEHHLSEGEEIEAVSCCIDAFEYLIAGDDESPNFSTVAGSMASLFAGRTVPTDPLESYESENEDIERLRDAVHTSVRRIGMASTISGFFTPAQKYKYTTIASELTSEDPTISTHDAEEILSITVENIIDLQTEGIIE